MNTVAAMSRKKFIESHGATCRNWTWSWSFVNPKEKFVIFGAWNRHTTRDKALILDEEWERSAKGLRQPGYAQALEHIRLVESGGYSLKIFRMLYSDELKAEDKQAPAKIRGFVPKLETKQLVKEGSKWFAAG
ncbi:MAG: hypothetical protein IT328_18280 [Caldilineaceae bacterium]|nr:hypothetical protein [Caldilineaceae bacterium]